jgi:hypothetical protein
MFAHQERGVFFEIYQLFLPTDLMPHHSLVHNSYIHEQFPRYIEPYAIYTYTPIEITQATRERSLASLDMVKLLLEHKFDSEGGTCPREQITYELAYRGSDVQRVMKEAVLAQREVFREDYIPPVRKVWNEESQEVELAEYILTPWS